jgi:hypothetical protein
LLEAEKSGSSCPKRRSNTNTKDSGRKQTTESLQTARDHKNISSTTTNREPRRDANAGKELTSGSVDEMRAVYCRTVHKGIDRLRRQFQQLRAFVPNCTRLANDQNPTKNRYTGTLLQCSRVHFSYRLACRRPLRRLYAGDSEVRVTTFTPTG